MRIVSSITKNHNLGQYLTKKYSVERSFYINYKLDNLDKQYANFATLQQIINFGKNINSSRLIMSANYVKNELLVRIARRIRDFQNLPFIVNNNNNLRECYALYWNSFEKLKQFPSIDSLNNNNNFCLLLQALLREHRLVIPKLALGVSECSSMVPEQKLDQFMRCSLTSRVSRRLLAEQHIILSKNFKENNNNDTVGLVSNTCDVYDILTECYNDLQKSKFYIQSKFPFKPLIVKGNRNVKFTYIPKHLKFVLCELLKQSIRSCFNKSYSKGESPEIEIVIHECGSSIDLRISDNGRGYTPEKGEKLWTFAKNDDKYRSYLKNLIYEKDLLNGNQINSTNYELSEIGLPLTKIFVDYFKGAINVVNLPGYGTDTYLKLCKAGSQTENLISDPGKCINNIPKSKVFLESQK